MSSHDTLAVESQKASEATRALIIAQTSELLLQACGLGSEPRPDQLSQIQQGEPPSRGRGRPRAESAGPSCGVVCCCVHERRMHSFADWRRLLGLEPIGPFAPVWLTRNGLVKRLRAALAWVPCKSCGRPSMHDSP